LEAAFKRLLAENQHVLLGQFLPENLFTVPPNQRPYSWTVDDWEDLWEDILEIKERIEDEEADPFYGFHFFGPMFFMREGSNGALRILDGQQRLATVELLFAAIRDIMGYFQIKGIMTPAGRDLSGKVSGFAEPAGIRTPTRITLGGDNKSFFEKVLTPIAFADPATANLFSKNEDLKEESKEYASNESILTCYRYFVFFAARTIMREHGEEWPKGRPDYTRITHTLVEHVAESEALLNRAYEAVAGRFYVLKAVVPDLEIMYRMFETLNQRGEKLVVADLFKNLLFERFERRISEQDVVSLWTDFENAVTDDFVGDFIRHYWLSRYRFVRTNDLFREIKQEIDRLPTNQSFRVFMQDITSEASTYRQLRSPKDSQWPQEIKQIADEIRYLGFRQGYPLLLAGHVRLFQNNQPKFTELMTTYLNLVVRSYTILAANPSELETRYSEWAIAIRQGSKTADQIIAEIKAETPSDEQLREGLIEMNGVSPQVGHYILTKINDSLSDELAAAWPNHPTVEHVVPQSPEAEWTTYLEANGMKAKSFIERLGNLTILSKEANEELGNLPYDTKRAKYLETRLPINTSTFEDNDFDVFNAVAIRRREEIIADLAIENELWK
jgi:Protein of unknown function DUF262/Protein of unknown function (DUF1524)